MSPSPQLVPPQPQPLSVSRGAALYIGALLGPGLLLLPGLAAAQAGPASILAWLVLLCVSALLAIVFAALGRAYPSAGGVAGYTAAGLGARAGAAAGWCFLAGVVCGAPVVCLIGAGYITGLTGGGQAQRCAVATALLLVVLALAVCGVRATAGVQLALVTLLIVVIVVAVAGSAPAARGGNWAPFAPHGWASIGHAASTLMLSFVGWEAVAPLTTRFRNPRRQLARVIAAAFAATTAVYLSLAVATIAVLGRRAATDVPLADLLQQAIGPAGRAAAAIAAVVLTLGATNAYLSGATTLATELTTHHAGRSPARPFLAIIGAGGFVVIGVHALHLASTAQLVVLPTTLFLAVYLGCTVSAARTLAGRARLAALLATIPVVVILPFSGWALGVTTAVAAAAVLGTLPRITQGVMIVQTPQRVTITEAVRPVKAARVTGRGIGERHGV